MKNTKDPTYEMVREVYMRIVPSQSEIANPFSANKRKRKTSLVPKTPNELPEELSEWTNRHFVDYFAEQYKKYLNGTYKKTYSSDSTFINQIFEFMEANELNRNEWTRKFIDWCFLNKEMVSRKTGSFLLINLKDHLNTFFQQVISKNRESAVAIDIFHELQEMDKNGRTKEIFTVYGIPIAATYFHNHKNVSLKSLQSGLKQLFESYLKGDQEQQGLLMKTVQRSINRSPYLNDFVLLDWREVFPEVVNKFNKEPWYRDVDYTGNPQYKLDKFLTKD